MTDRDRLIETQLKAYKEWRNNTNLDISVAEFTTDYILADGWIRPPCKVGDVVWFDTYKKSGTVSLGIQPHKVDRIDVICVVGEKELVETKLHDWYFGKTVFLTKEEAEAHLSQLLKGE